MKLIVFTASYAVLRSFSQAYGGLGADLKRELELRLFNPGATGTEADGDLLREAIRQADVILHDPHGIPDEALEKIVKQCCTAKARQFPAGGDSGRVGSALQLEEDGELRGYWHAGGEANIRSLLLYLGRRYGELSHWPAPEAPQALDGIRIYDPVNKRICDTVAQAKSIKPHVPDKPTVAVLFMGTAYPLDMHPVVAGMIRHLEVYANILPLAFGSITEVDTSRLRELLLHGGYGGEAVSLIVNLIPFRLGSGPVGGDSAAVIRLLEELKAPLLHPVILSQRLRKEWSASPEGLSPGEFLVQMLLPELDGAIELFPIAAMEEEVYDRELQIGWKNLSLIEDRAERLARKTGRWLALQAKPRHAKKLSIICYNYPPGEASLFGASFMDTFASVSVVLSRLKEAGYEVQEMSAEELRNAFVEGGLVNSAMWSSGGEAPAMLRYPYSKCKEELLKSPYGEELRKQWGEAPGEIMTDGDDFLIPGLVNGNVFIGLQPARGIHEQPEKAYHDKSLLPHYQYFAFYHYIKEEFGADAILHMGTHGTLEFTPGKEAGMSGECVPDMLTGELPHLYYYYVGNPAEAMAAKRRSHAVLLSYQSPPLAEGGLYGEYAELDTLLNDYRQAERLNPGQCGDIWARAKSKAEALHLNAGDPDELEDEVYEMRRSLIPKGLHVLGEGYNGEEAAQYMKFVLRHDRHGIRSLPALTAEAKGLDYEALAAENKAVQLQELDEDVDHFVNQYVETGEIPAPPVAAAPYPDEWRQTWEFGRQAYQAASANKELEQLIRLLDGEYAPVRLAGDSIRHPDILPTGYNLYQFDCRSVPSDTAAERGAVIADNIVKLYQSRHGQLPETTALVMWGLETSRTQGETFGAILRLLGIRIAGRSRFSQPVYEFIPLAELGRPRLNVVVNICGFFRDMFPNLLAELNELFRKTSELDENEEQNWFKRHTYKLYRRLQQEGMEPEEAWDLAAARIFGPAAAEYASNMTKLIETKAWTEEAELGESCLKSFRYVYSKNSRGRELEELYRSRLQEVELVSQLRSSYEHEVIDLDHFYEFFGGLSKSVELSRGKSPEIYITDTSAERTRTEDAASSIARGLRTRLLNPKWIDAMLEHSYHGVQNIADRFENMLGLAATTHKVESWMFSRLHQVYVADEERSRRLEENNRWAYHELLETMLECHQRRYWQASAEELEQLRSRYMKLEGEIEATI